MNAIKPYIGVLVTALALTIGGAIGYGRVQEICRQVQEKADKASVTREMDQIQKHLDRIEGKLDELIAK